MQAPEPGIYFDVDHATYRAWPYPSQTIFKEFERSPAHALYKLRRPDEQTEDQKLGAATDLAILEPELFDMQFAVGPQYRQKKHEKDEWKAIEAAGMQVLRPSEHRAILEIRNAVWEHPVAGPLVNGKGKTKIKVVWDEETPSGTVRCKAEIDWYTHIDGWNVVCDLKATRDARPWNFQWDAGKFGYHVQAATYLRALDAAAGPMDRAYRIIAVEKPAASSQKSAYPGVVVMEYDEGTLAEANRQVDAALEAWARCHANDHWPGYAEEVHPLALPEKFWRRE